MGDYVASAVLCFAYGHHSVLLDTNTVRIARRIIGSGDLPKWEVRLKLYRLSGRLGPDADWNYALLDLGGSVCKARRPLCSECPVSQMCVTGRDRLAQHL